MLDCCTILATDEVQNRAKDAFANPNKDFCINPSMAKSAPADEIWKEFALNKEEQDVGRQAFAQVKDVDISWEGGNSHQPVLDAARSCACGLGGTAILPPSGPSINLHKTTCLSMWCKESKAPGVLCAGYQAYFCISGLIGCRTCSLVEVQRQLGCKEAATTLARECKAAGMVQQKPQSLCSAGSLWARQKDRLLGEAYIHHDCTVSHFIVQRHWPSK